MKKTSKLLGLIIFLLVLVISGCRNQDDLSLENVGLSHNNSRGEPWPNVLIWYKTDKRRIGLGDNLSLKISFTNHERLEKKLIVPARLVLNRQIYTDNNSVKVIETIVLKEIDDFSSDFYYADVFTSNENTLEVNMPDEWFMENTGNFRIELYLFSENDMDNFQYKYTLVLYYRKIDDIIYFYSSKHNFENNINE